MARASCHARGHGVFLLSLAILLLSLSITSAAGGQVDPLTHKLEDGGICETCLVAGRVVSDFLCDDTFITWAITDVEEVACNSLSGKDKDQCAQLIEVLLPLALEYARTSFTPESLCSFAGLCKPDMAVPPNKAKQLMHRLHSDASQCAQCRYVARTVKASKKSSHDVVAEAQAACLALPEDLALSCSSMLETSGNLFKDLINFDRTCELLGPCTWGFLEEQFGGSSLPAPLSTLTRVMRQARADLTSPPLEDASSCDKCKLTVLEVRMVVNSAAVQQSLVNVSRALCGHVAPYEDECRAMIDKYSPVAFSLVDKYLQPETVCGSLLHLCPIREQRQAALLPAKRLGYPYIQQVLDRLHRMWQGRSNSWTS